MTKSKLEKVLEHMVNDEMDLANDLLHEHIVEAARNIYADLAEEDDLAEAELELDEDEDLDEGYDDSDKSDDFEDDIETMEDEVEAEEHFAEDEDEDAAMDDLEGEMDMDVDGELAGDEGAEGEGGVEDAMVNVEDALDELRAAFADMMGDEDDEDMGDEVADELDDMEDGGEEDELMAGHYMEDEDLDESDDEELEESATLKKHGNVTMAGDEDGKASPVKQNQPDMSNGHAKPVNFAGGDEKGGKGDSAKKMNVTGPQDQGGKFDKKVAKPSNSSEKAKSNIGS